MSVRYRPKEKEHLLLSKYFKELVEMQGHPADIQSVESVEFTNQGEPIYIRRDAISTYVMFEEPRKSKRDVIQEKEPKRKLLVPILSDDNETIFDLDIKGSLIEFTTDFSVLPSISNALWIANNSELASDRTHWILTITPYQNSGFDSTEPDSGGVIDNDSILGEVVL